MLNYIRNKVGLKRRDPRDTYTVRHNGQEQRLRDDQFGNYIAGYLTQYYRGTVVHVHLAGDFEAGGKDDSGSMNMINMGAADAKAYKEKLSGNKPKEKKNI